MVTQLSKLARQSSQSLFLGGSPLLTAVVFSCLTLYTESLQAGSYIWIDPDSSVGARKIPDITGNPGDSVTLGVGGIIDLLILGDGYLGAESTTFKNDAQNWYDTYFGFNGNPGLRPFTYFKEAFRVRAVWEPSTARACTTRTSHYRVKIDGNGDVSGDGWWDGSTGSNLAFRDSVFKTVDSLPTPKDTTRYPSTLNNTVGGNQTISAMADRYSNMYIVMLIKPCVGTSSSGYTFDIKKPSQPQRIMAGVGENRFHEFGHAFGYLKDEYINDRTTSATFSNPAANDRSVFNLSNLTYTKARCDLPWKHLAPGEQYNANPFSLIGNLFMGGGERDDVWHSEYRCLINGTHENYWCDLAADSIRLRDDYAYCFWCEELLALRILERTDQLVRPTDSTDINAKGRVWFRLWDTSLREAYYNYFNLESLIVLKDSCWALYAGGTCGSCSTSCDILDDNGPPPCLPDCDIREVGNAVYVDGTNGNDASDGSEDSPKKTLLNAVAAACGAQRLVMLKPTSYPGAVTITGAATLIPHACTPVTIGK
ncbi:MAG TPA: hypothetical protein VN285_08830 [Candidatus Deferrimicrobium sp.]|nr:hypothetical protein [Candidatus Deferrimicrobium sp.]